MHQTLALQAVSFANGIPVHIGPVCLRPRFNNVATAPQPGPTRDDLTEGYGAEFTSEPDDRQRAPELAAWTIASAAALAVPGVASLAYFEEWGPRGIRSRSGTPYPVADAIDAITALAGLPLLYGESPDGLVWALGARTDAGAAALAANLGPSARDITIEVDGTLRQTTLPAGGWVSL